MTDLSTFTSVTLLSNSPLVTDISGNASTATKLGTATIGSTVKPFYLSAGTPTAFSTTVGSTSKGVYMNAGSITEMSATVGSSTAPVYMNAGTITACGTSLGVSITGNASTASSTTLLKWIGDKRSGFKPTDIPTNGLVLAFASQGSLASQTNDSDWCDVIGTNT